MYLRLYQFCNYRSDEMFWMWTVWTEKAREPEAGSAPSAGSMWVLRCLVSRVRVGGKQEEMNVDELTTEGEKSMRDVETKNDSNGAKPKKNAKVHESESDGDSDFDSELESSDSSIPVGQKNNGYTLQQVRSFWSFPREEEMSLWMIFPRNDHSFLIWPHG